jgi:sugar-specific transcriptional regulator TrmB
MYYVLSLYFAPLLLMFINNTLQLLQTLKDIGLTANEANVYLALHSIGQNPASVVAKKAELNRSSCYTILNSLMQKGFIQQAIKNNIAYFNATDPRHILQHLRIKKFEIDENIQNLGNLTTQFNTLRNNYSKRPKVVFFEGCAGIRNVMEESLMSSEKLRVYSSINELTKLLHNYFPEYYKRRTERGIFVNAIFPASKEAYMNKMRDKQENRESRLIPSEFNFHLDIIIYDNKVVITSLKEKFGLSIESEEMAIAQKGIFDLIWNATKKYDIIMADIMKKNIENENNKEQAKKPPGTISIS